MAFLLDSLSIESLAAAILFAVTIWSWWMARDLRVRNRVYFRFAAVLLAALAAALPLPSPGLAFNVMLIAASARSGIAAKDAISPMANAAIRAVAESQGGAPWRNAKAKASAALATLAASSITLKARPGDGTGSATASAASSTAAKRR